jgi:hypothetical protein
MRLLLILLLCSLGVLCDENNPPGVGNLLEQRMTEEQIAALCETDQVSCNIVKSFNVDVDKIRARTAETKERMEEKRKEQGAARE